MDFYKKLIELQNKVKVSKENYNAFGKYQYRKCEDILEAAKPIAYELGLFIYISDEVVNIGERFYICATATITDGTGKVENKSYAREPEEKKGMDSSQVTGTSSSYARKFALSGLLGLDDSKDVDEPEQSQKNKVAQKSRQSQVTGEKIEDEKERSMLIANILGGLGDLSKGADASQKAQILKQYCGVNAFAEISKTKTIQEMKAIIEKIKAGLNEIEVRNKK